MSGTEFRLLSTDEELQQWDAMVGECPGGTIYHSSCWQKMLNDSGIDGEFQIRGLFVDGQLTGGYTGLVRRTLGVPTIVTPLCTPYCGFLMRGGDGADRAGEIGGLVEGGTSFGKVSFQCLDLPEEFCRETYRGLTFTPRRTWEIDLRQDEGTTWRNMKGSVHRQIRKAEKNGVVVEESLDVAAGYDMLQATFIRQGEQCPISRELFQGIGTHPALAPHRRIFAARLQGELVGFVVAIHDCHKVYYALASSSPEGMAVGASSLLIWKVMQASLGAQWDRFDFVGGNNPSISKFKENFGPELKHYYAVDGCNSLRLRTAYAARGLIRRWRKA